MEEGSEFLERFQGNGPLPLITSCSSAWMKYMEQFYPGHASRISRRAKSPMSMASALFKTYWAEKMKIDPKKILSVAVMCCTAKKYEAARPELEVHGMRATDIVVTTREIGWMIKSAGIDFVNIKPKKARRSAGPVLRRRRHLRRHRRRHGSGHPHRVRAVHGRDPDRHRDGRHPRLQGRQGSQDHPGRQGAAARRRARPGQRPQGHGDGPQGSQSLPLHRDHGLPRRLHRRRRPALRHGQLDSAR